jgi:heme-degrading monooxygenase HmoA
LPSHSFLVVWEFTVRAGSEQDFERRYGPEGDWARLFARDPEYLRTELQRDLRTQGRYLTLDYWGSEAAYESFHGRHRAEYDDIDRQCEDLTKTEILIGRFVLVDR